VWREAGLAFPRGQHHLAERLRSDADGHVPGEAAEPAGNGHELALPLKAGLVNTGTVAGQPYRHCLLIGIGVPYATCILFAA
jgi:hypothetical protein